jgi:hypothetical protein
MPLLIFLSLAALSLPHSPSLTGLRHPPRQMTWWLTNLYSQNVHNKIKVITVPAGQNQVFSIKNDHTIKVLSLKHPDM